MSTKENPAADGARGAFRVADDLRGGGVNSETSKTNIDGQDHADLLSQAVATVRPHLRRDIPISERLRTFWAGVAAAVDLAATDQVVSDFMEIACNTGLAADLGRHRDADLQHIISWALAGRDPFGGAA